MVVAAGAPNPLVPALPELILGAVSFLIVFGVLLKVLMPRLQQTLAERTEAIEGGLQRAEEAQKEADEALAQYRAQLDDARREASRLRERAREEGAQIVAEAREQGQAERQRLVDAAHAQIAADRAQALQALKTEVGTIAVQLASRVVGESLEQQARQRRTVDRFLEELESQAQPEGARTS